MQLIYLGCARRWQLLLVVGARARCRRRISSQARRRAGGGCGAGEMGDWGRWPEIGFAVLF